MMKTLFSLCFVMILSLGFGQFASFPLVLSLPYDQDTIETTEPTFVWQCNLSAIQSDPRLSLQFALVALEAEQTAAEAIATNEAICVVNGLVSSSYNYPSTLEELQKGKTYVWQVQLLFNDQAVQESEPWKFTIADPKIPKDQFIVLRRQADGSRYVLNKPELYIMIPNDKVVETRNAIVRNSKNESVAVVLEEVNAENSSAGREANLYYHVDLKEKNLKKGDYTFEWRSGKGQVYSLWFRLED